MERKEFLKKMCGAGLCVCAAPFALEAAIEKPQDKNDTLKRLEWWNAHIKKQLAKLWETMGDYLDEEKQSEIIEQLGRNCFNSLPWLHKFKGDPEGYFKSMNDGQGEKFTYDRDKGIIMIETPERDCVCEMVDSSFTPPIFCNCSLGWQKQAYEIILDKKVEVEILESVLRGSKRCVFKITIV